MKSFIKYIASWVIFQEAVCIALLVFIITN